MERCASGAGRLSNSLAAFAKSLGRTDVYTKFATRAQDWTNVFNPQTGYLQAKNKDGQFAGGFTPGTSNGFVEGTSAQYTPMVPFNLRQLIQVEVAAPLRLRIAAVDRLAPVECR